MFTLLYQRCPSRRISNFLVVMKIYNNHSSFTQNTSLKGKHNTCNLPQRSPAHRYQRSVPQAELTVSFMSQCVSICLSLHSLAVSDSAHMPTLCVMIRFSRPHSMFKIQQTASEINQIKHQLDATLCRFYFCRVTLHVSGVKRPSSGVLKNWHGGPWYRCYSCR